MGFARGFRGLLEAYMNNNIYNQIISRVLFHLIRLLIFGACIVSMGTSSFLISRPTLSIQKKHTKITGSLKTKKKSGNKKKLSRLTGSKKKKKINKKTGSKKNIKKIKSKKLAPKKVTKKVISYAKPILPKIPVHPYSKQLTVLPQTDINGGMASCGYQALKNGIVIAQELTYKSGNLHERLNDPALIALLFEPLTINGDTTPGYWREIIINHRMTQQAKTNMPLDMTGENIHEHEIRMLIDFEQLPGGMLDGLPNDCITVITSIDELNPKYSHIFAQMHTRINHIRGQLNNSNNFHVFVIGNMKHTAGSYGHWFTLVAHNNINNNICEYLITDSAHNTHRLSDIQVHTLITALENGL